MLCAGGISNGIQADSHTYTHRPAQMRLISIVHNDIWPSLPYPLCGRWPSSPAAHAQPPCARCKLPSEVESGCSAGWEGVSCAGAEVTSLCKEAARPCIPHILLFDHPLDSAPHLSRLLNPFPLPRSNTNKASIESHAFPALHKLSGSGDSNQDLWRA